MRCVDLRDVRVVPKDGSPSILYQAPCGKCYACRYNKTQMWIDRLEMESFDSITNPLFLTLTYSDAHIPRNSEGLPELCLRDVQTFLKRLRKAIHPLKVRYVYLGEYGGRTVRPHYHFILFPSAPFNHSLISEKWFKGHVMVSPVTPRRLAYVASFHINSAECPSGRTLPFVQYSRNPGLGYSYIEKESNVSLHTQEIPDLTYVRLNGRTRPLPPYIRKKLFPDGYPLELNTVPLNEYLKDRYPDLKFHEACDYVRKLYKHRLNKQLQKHGKYIQSRSNTPDKEVNL